jgi:hypothetical protein
MNYESCDQLLTLGVAHYIFNIVLCRVLLSLLRMN